VQRVATLALVLAVGCKFHPPQATADDDAIGLADAAPDTLGPPGDRDGDGVLDGTDNCPDNPNPDQRDHDHDAIGDVCDLCPHIADSGTTDTDGDHIGDVCDPRPDLPDTRLLFVGFYDQAEIADWSQGGTWTFDGKTARHQDSGDVAFLSPPMTYTRAAIQTGILVDDVLAVDNRGFGVVTGATDPLANPVQGYFCFMLTNNSGEVYTERRDGTTTPIGAQTSWPPMISGSTLRLDLNIDTMIACHVQSSTDNVTVATLTPGPSTGRVLLVSQFAQVRYDYLFVIGLGP
jgi:hypothetical protein